MIRISFSPFGVGIELLPENDKKRSLTRSFLTTWQTSCRATGA